MYAMQYAVTLPADHDMKIIRDRVAGRGRLTDAYEDLGSTACLIRERGTAGSPVDEYAPSYLWKGTGGMNRFLWGGGGFGGIVDDFGRPTSTTGRAPPTARVPRPAPRRAPPRAAAPRGRRPA